VAGKKFYLTFTGSPQGSFPLLKGKEEFNLGFLERGFFKPRGLEGLVWFPIFFPSKRGAHCGDFPKAFERGLNPLF